MLVHTQDVGLKCFYCCNIFCNDWCECVGECARHHDIFLVHLSLGNKVVLYCIVMNTVVLYCISVKYFRLVFLLRGKASISSEPFLA